jgi:hypothetical protein
MKHSDHLIIQYSPYRSRQGEDLLAPTSLCSAGRTNAHTAPTPPTPIANPTFNRPWGGVYSMPLTVTHH